MCPIECAGLEVRGGPLNQDILVQAHQPLLGIAIKGVLISHKGSHCGSYSAHLESVGVVLLDTSRL
jgi:hypothetical protein